MRYKKNNRGSYILTGKDGEEFKVTKKEYEEIKKFSEATYDQVEQMSLIIDELKDL